MGVKRLSLQSGTAADGCVFPVSCRRLLLPSSSQGLINVHEGQTLVERGIDQVELRREAIRFTGTSRAKGLTEEA
jgi:hypothetical protein